LRYNEKPSIAVYVHDISLTHMNENKNSSHERKLPMKCCQIVGTLKIDGEVAGVELILAQ